MSIHIELLDTEDVHCMDFSGLDIYSRYRGMKFLEKSDHERIFRSDCALAIDAGGRLVAAFADDALKAICVLAPLDWDSRHFGIAMANLTVCAVPGCEGQIFRTLLEEVVLVGGALGIRHFSVELDIDDYGCLNPMLAFGFEILDIKRSYRCGSLMGVKTPKFRSCVREYRPGDRDRVIEMAGSSVMNGRFSRDRFLSAEKIGDLYRIWFEKLLDCSESSSIALVFERGGMVEACGVIGATDLSYAGVSTKFMDKGVYVSGSHGIGGYFPVLYELISRSLLRHDMAQTSVSLNNHSAVRVLEKMNVGSESTRYALRLFR